VSCSPVGSTSIVLIFCRPVRTYNTAVVYYHKFRLVHPDGQGYIVSEIFTSPRFFSDRKVGRCSGSAFRSLQNRRHVEEIKRDTLRCP